ncbi:MAG: hypothetical protein U1F43_31830 [Myxococcota bacterium]
MSADIHRQTAATQRSLVTSPISWFEIPPTTFARATAFYEKVLGTLRWSNAGLDGGLPHDAVPSGAGEGRRSARPWPVGHRVYFAVDHAPGGLEGCPRLQGRGGRRAVLLPKTDIGELGFIGLVRDTEGNVVGSTPIG